MLKMANILKAGSMNKLQFTDLFLKVVLTVPL